TDARRETGDLRARDCLSVSVGRTMERGASCEYDPFGWFCLHDHDRRHSGGHLAPHPGRGRRDAGDLSAGRSSWPFVVAPPTALKRATSVACSRTPVPIG